MESLGLKTVVTIGLTGETTGESPILTMITGLTTAVTR